jgi:hypothetical protein
MQETEYREKLTAAGFTAIDIEPTRVYKTEDAKGFLQEAGIDAGAVAADIDGKFMSAFVRARKPVPRA